MKEFVARHAPPPFSPPALDLPSVAALRRAAQRARASAPGPDRLPYRAWTATPGALDVLDDI
eukprot:2264960-Pyramimonas_sp.AAC.1